MYNSFVGSVFIPKGVEVTDDLIGQIKYATNSVFSDKKLGGFLNHRAVVELEDGSTVDVFCGEHHSFATYSPARYEYEEQVSLYNPELIPPEYVPSGLAVQYAYDPYTIQTVNGNTTITPNMWLFSNDGSMYKGWPGRTEDILRIWNRWTSEYLYEFNWLLTPEAYAENLTRGTFCQAFGKDSTPLEERELYGGLTYFDGATPAYAPPVTEGVDPDPTIREPMVWPIQIDEETTYYAHMTLETNTRSFFISKTLTNNRDEWYQVYYSEPVYSWSRSIGDVSTDGTKFMVVGWDSYENYDTAPSSHAILRVYEYSESVLVIEDPDDITSWWWDTLLVRSGGGPNNIGVDFDDRLDPNHPDLQWLAYTYYWDNVAPEDIPHEYFCAFPKLTVEVVTSDPDPNDCGYGKIESTYTVEWPEENQFYFHDWDELATLAPALWSSLNLGAGTTRIPPFTYYSRTFSRYNAWRYMEIGLVGVYYDETNTRQETWKRTLSVPTVGEASTSFTTSGTLKVKYTETTSWDAGEYPSCVVTSSNASWEVLDDSAMLTLSGQNTLDFNITTEVFNAAGQLTVTHSSSPASVTFGNNTRYLVQEGFDSYSGAPNFFWGAGGGKTNTHTPTQGTIGVTGGASLPFKAGRDFVEDVLFDNNDRGTIGYGDIGIPYMYLTNGFHIITGYYVGDIDEGGVYNTVTDGCALNQVMADRDSTSYTSNGGTCVTSIDFDKPECDNSNPAERVYGHAALVEAIAELDRTIGTGRRPRTSITNVFTNVTCGSKLTQLVIVYSDDYFTDIYNLPANTYPTNFQYAVSSILTPSGVIAVNQQPALAEAYQPDGRVWSFRDTYNTFWPYTGEAENYVWPHQMGLFTTYNPITKQLAANFNYPLAWVGVYGGANQIPDPTDPNSTHKLNDEVISTQLELPMEDYLGTGVILELDADDTYTIVYPE